MKPCPSCDGQMAKVIYLGLPGRWCDDCSVLDGLAAHAPPIATETDHGPMFQFMIYEGNYFAAWWHWLTHWGDE